MFLNFLNNLNEVAESSSIASFGSLSGVNFILSLFESITRSSSASFAESLQLLTKVSMHQNFEDQILYSSSKFKCC